MYFPMALKSLENCHFIYKAMEKLCGDRLKVSIIQRPKDVVEALKSQGMWENEMPAHYSEHPLIKRKCSRQFCFPRTCSPEGYLEALQEPPYGLIPSPIGILLLHFCYVITQKVIITLMESIHYH